MGPSGWGQGPVSGGEAAGTEEGRLPGAKLLPAYSGSAIVAAPRGAGRPGFPLRLRGWGWWREMGAMVRPIVGPGEGKPEWDWGSRRECTALGHRGGLGFSSPGTGTRAWFSSS